LRPEGFVVEIDSLFSSFRTYAVAITGLYLGA
jgi:hypothetical protein